MLNGHGNDIHNYPNIKADFSSNIWFQGPPPALVNFIKEKVQSIANYPEPAADSFCRHTENFYSLTRNSVLATNGSAEAFYLIARLFSNKPATILHPSFAEYQSACTANNTQINWISNAQVNEQTYFNTKTCWLGNPNNPEGKVFTYSTIELWLKNNPETLYIIDEAYAELCTEFESVIPLLGKYKNLIIIQSFTKAFAIPGLRLGIILSSPELTNKLSKFQIPWSVNSLAALTGTYILNNYQSLLFDKELMHKLSKELQQEIDKLKNFKTTPSNCNYFLVKTKAGTAANLKKYLANEHGILIRNADNFYGLSKQHFRIAIRGKEQNQQLIKALAEWNG